MSTRVAFELQRRTHAEPATALLFLSNNVEDLLRLCARLGQDPLPAVYPVADGFLVQFARPVTEPVAEALELRNLASHLLVPVDADLVPALLEDEAAALVSRRGLVFLPGGRVLEFNPREPMPPAALVTVKRVTRSNWNALPDAPELPERIVQITLAEPPERADEILQEGGADIGTEDPRPANSTFVSKVLGKAAVRFGKGLAGLGSALHLSALARLGANLIGKGLNMAPRLSESLLGKQEAALRYLLQRLRAGDIDWALRHAVPLSEARPRGAVPHGGAQLPTHHPFYSLRNILAGSGAALWFSSADAYHDLEREYRNLATEAARAGDYRRAAYIYGKLLKDFRAAAAILAQGGLHHDAATLYLQRVGDTLAAAREYEAAGAFDEALSLYRRRGEHVEAAELLRRMGEEDLASAEFQVAATKLAQSGHGDFQAGELLSTRAQRPDLALPYYLAGWRRRLQENSVLCAIRLIEFYADRGETEKVLEVMREGEAFLLPPGNDSAAADFFHELSLVAVWPQLSALRDDLRDRALLGIATKARQQAHAGMRAAEIATKMFRAAPAWPPATVSDAQYAVQAAVERRQSNPASAPLTTTTIQGRIPVVTAVTWAAAGGCLFLGFESGEVFCYRLLNGEIGLLSETDLPVNSLATDQNGDYLVAFRSDCAVHGIITSYKRTTGGFRQAEQADFKIEQDSWLCSHLAGHQELFAGFWNGGEFQLLDRRTLTTEALLQVSESPSFGFHAAVILHTPPELTVLGFSGSTVANCRAYPAPEVRQFKILGWSPSTPEKSQLATPVIDCRPIGPDEWELTGVNEDGVVYRSALAFHKGALLKITTHTAAEAKAYLAVAFTRPGALAAVTPRGIHWMQVSSKGLRLRKVSDVSLPSAIACFAHHGELIIVCTEGKVVRVPFPS
ncbi:MAG TPA: hypothetical protein VG099_31095 [Gemmataceae bacterium]|jgi:hypothetical protein|nr:hypothetical protein [Gemmataceae bacterium]